MIKRYLTKAIALATIVTLIIAFNPVGANAELEQGNNTITAPDARELILKEDGIYISKITDDSTRFSTDYTEYSDENMPGSNAWNLPKEPCYEFYVHAYETNGEIAYDSCEYLVGKESKNVYIAPNQGGMSLYQIKNNEKVKTFKYMGEENSYEWH
jgi:hypothetical protein